MENTVAEALDNLASQSSSLFSNRLHTTPFDADWHSPCIQKVDGDSCFWQPVPQSPRVNFAGLEHALEMTIHPDIVAYYSCFWSGTLETNSQEGQVSLIQLWNAEDFDRLIANLIGHAMVKQKQRENFSVFFANTEPDSEMFLSIDNQTGKILLEEAGKKDHRIVESDIRTFLTRLQPVVRQSDIY